MSRWPEVTFETALDALIDYRGKTPKKALTGIPVISAKVVKSGRISDDIEQRISPDYYHEWMRRGTPQVGDVVLTTEGPLGEVARLDQKSANFALGQRVVTLRGKSGYLDNGYLKYLLISQPMQDRLHGRATGSTVAGISQKSLREMEIPIAPIEEQRKIASILGALDEKIELNRTTAATLDAMMQVLYRSWFVDFDPVRARAEGSQPAHMDAATAALFPDSFGENGLPAGWALASIYDLARVQYGAPFASSRFNTSQEGRPLVRIRDLKSQLPGVWTTEEHRNEFLIEPGDIVVGMDGDFTPYTWCSAPALMNQRVCCFVPCIERDRAFVRLCISDLLKAEEEAAVATTVIHLGKKDIDKFRVPSAPQEVMAAFSQFALPWHKRAVLLGLENRTLVALRDTLLPRLMSGELRFNAARELIEEVT